MDDEKDNHPRFMKWMRTWHAHTAEWKKEATENYDFYASHQWTEDEMADFDEKSVPPIVFNRIARTINGVIGLEVQNRQEVKFYPREMTDVKKGEILSNAAKWVRDNCDAEDEDSEAFSDLLICGMGFTETYLDYETDEDGAIIIERRDPFEMGWDVTSRKRNLDDGKYIFRIKKMSVEEFESKFPGKEVPSSSKFSMTTEIQTQEFKEPEDLYTQEFDAKTDDGLIEVCQMQYYEVEKYYPVSDKGGIVDLPEQEYEGVKEELSARGMKSTKKALSRRKYYTAFFTSEEVLEDEPSPCNMCSFRAMTGLRDRNNNRWFGLVSLMRDPQKWANKWMIQIQQILSTQAKSGKLMWETGAFSNPQKAQAEWSDPTATVQLNTGGLGKILQIQPAQYPQGLDRLLQYALEAISEAPGTNAEMLGQADRNQPGILEQTRKQSGITVVAVFFDALRRYRKESGRVLAAYIREYIADGRLIRITGEYGAETIPLLRDELAMKYDIIVDIAPTSPNVKDQTFAALTQILPTIMEAQIPVPPDLLDYLPVSESLIGKWKKYIADTTSSPETQKKNQIAMAGAEADVQNKQADAAKKQADARKADAEAQTPPENKQADKMQEFNLKRELGYAEIDLKRELETLRIQGDQELQFLKQKSDSESKSEIAQMTSKPATTVQLGDGSVGEQLALALQSGMQQSNMVLADSLTRGMEFIAQSNIEAMGQVAAAIEESSKKTVTMKTSAGKTLTATVN